MNKKLLTVGILLVLAAAVAGGFYAYKQQHIVEEVEIPFSVEKTELSGGQLPTGFPKDLPIAAGANILENYEAKASDGRLQSTISFTTQANLEAAVASYVEFFEGKNWLEIEGLFSSATESVTAMMKYQEDRLMIEAKSDPSTNQHIVKLDLLQTAINN